MEQAVSLGRDFVRDAATDERMIHGDLHYENVLAADREPWLAIDPKPVAGDPHYEARAAAVEPVGRGGRVGDVREAVRRRFFTLVDAADARRGPGPGLGGRPRDPQRALGDRGRRARGPCPRRGGAGRITRAVTIAKAVQD